MTIKSELKQGKAYWFLTKDCKEYVGYINMASTDVLLGVDKSGFSVCISYFDIQDFKYLGV